MSRGNRIFLALVFVLAAVGLGITAVSVYRSGFWRGPDAQFGDQHLKTAVALIELHKVRHGQYPASLGDLTFVGEWDRIALSSVSYHVNSAQTKYCVEVERGWVGKPRLNVPPEFWQGTGFDPSLCR
jgi:hypothetical protein